MGQGNSEAYPKSGVWIRVLFSIMFYLDHVLGELRVDFILGHTFFHAIIIKKCGNLNAESKILRYYKARVYTSPNLYKDPF